MRKRETKAVQSADLLVCFPSRAHLTLLPKPICSPARPSESRNHHHQSHRRQNHHHPLKKSTTRNGGRGQASPSLWTKNRQVGSEITEPTSPKVTCAGQIKVRHKAGACKSWQSVMEEIERLHNNRKHKKRSTWIDSLGLKKDVMQFLTCLRNIRFDFRCFGSFPQSDLITTDDEDEEEEEYHESVNHSGVEGSSDHDHGDDRSRTVFSKWFMVLQENQNRDLNENCKEKAYIDTAVPPPNALLLMRCRSAPAKSWSEEKKENEQQDYEEENEDIGERGEKKGKNLKALMEEEKLNNMKEENLAVMRYETDFNKISTDIAKETWIVGGVRDLLSRSRSWKR